MRVTEQIECFNEDCMVVMARYPDKYFDLAVVDPPYGLGLDSPARKPEKIKQKNGSFLNVKSTEYKKKNWDKQKCDFKYFNELKRVSNHQIIFGENYYGIFAGGRIVWIKLNGESDQFDCEIAYNSINDRTDVVYFMWSGMIQGKYCGRNIRKALVQQGDKRKNEKRIHPAQKPIALYDWIFNNYAKPGMKVLDTHGGSMSSAISADRAGLEMVCCELDKEYFDKAVVRFNQYNIQRTLELKD